MIRTSRQRRPGSIAALAALAAIAVALEACGAPAPTPVPPTTPSPAPTARPAPAAALPADPAPPVEPPVAVGQGIGARLSILAPADRAVLPATAVVVSGVAPSGARVVLDGPLFLDESVVADAWGAWSMPLRLEAGEHELRFSLERGDPTARVLRLTVAPDPARAAPSVVWPPAEAALAGDSVLLRGSAAPGSVLRLRASGVGGFVAGVLGTAPRAVADASGRWTLRTPLAPGSNEILVAVDGGGEVGHALIRDDAAPSPAGVAPELDLRSTRILPFDDPEEGPGAQLVVEVANATDGWLDLGATGAGAGASAAVGGHAVRLVPVPRRVAPGATALLLGEVRSADGLEVDPTALRSDDLGISIGVAYAAASPPSDRGAVATFRLDAPAGEGLVVEGTFRGGAADDRFRVVVLAYDADGRLLAAGRADRVAPGAFRTEPLPLFGSTARRAVARLVGLVTVVEDVAPTS